MSFNDNEQSYEVRYLIVKCRRIRGEKAKLQNKCQKLIDNPHKLSGGKNV